MASFISSHPDLSDAWQVDQGLCDRVSILTVLELCSTSSVLGLKGVCCQQPDFTGVFNE